MSEYSCTAYRKAALIFFYSGKKKYSHQTGMIPYSFFRKEPVTFFNVHQIFLFQYAGPTALRDRGGGDSTLAVTGGGHSTLAVTGVLGQQLWSRGLSVRDFSPKKGVTQVRRPKIWGGGRGSNGENKTNFSQYSTSTNLDTFLTKILKKIENFDDLLSKNTSRSPDR